MTNTASRLISVALAEVGYLEKKSNADLDSVTNNAGHGNWNKYARDLDNIPEWYNGKKNGYDWCDVFVDWCFYKAFGAAEGRKLLCQPEKSYGASCTHSARYFKQAGQLFQSPQPGDQIFFTSNGGETCYHTGIVYEVDNTYVYTVEGNTNGGSGIVANGGGVFRKKYLKTHRGIYGYGRPAYAAQPENDAPESVTPESPEVGIEVQMWTNKDEQGCILDIGLQVDHGSIWYQVHTLNGRWLPKVTGFDPNDFINGYAGNHTPIDAIRVYYETPAGENYRQARYAVKTIQNPDRWLPDQVDDYTTNGMDGYAGNLGEAITDFRWRVDDK